MLSLTLPPMLLTTVQTVMRSMVPNMDTLSRDHRMRLGASLRDRATLPSPLRGLGPSGGYPSRLRSLRSLRAPLARRLAPLTAVAGPTRRCFIRPHGARHRLVLLATALRAALVAVPAPLALAGCGHRLGSSRQHSVRRRCRLRRSPARAPRRALVPAQVRTPPRALASPCCARPRAAPAALPAAQAPRRLRRAAVAGADFPNVDAARLGRPDRRGGLGSHTPRT